MKIDDLKKAIAFNDKALDCIADYAAITKMSRKKKADFFECINYMSRQMRCSVPKVVDVFGEFIKEEINRINSAKDELKESKETFSNTLLKEDETSDMTKQVSDAEKSDTSKQADIDTDEKNKSSDAVRKYYLYMNLEKGQMYICGKTEETTGLVNKTLTKLNNFLERCVSPELSKNGILIAPIKYELAKQYLEKFKGAIKYLDITPKKQDNSEQKQ